jgi:hypothetical protein
MNLIKVKNAIGTSKLLPPAPFVSWLEYYEYVKQIIMEGYLLYRCPVCGRICLRKELDGCHVQKVCGNDDRFYIVPLCSSCNHRTDEFLIDESLLLLAPIM